MLESSSKFGRLCIYLVYSEEAKVAILANFTILGPIYHERRIASGSKFVAVSVVDSKGDRLTTKPVTC